MSEQERQEIIRFLEADKALPDKYRFLLFDKKREVEFENKRKSSECKTPKAASGKKSGREITSSKTSDEYDGDGSNYLER